MEGNTKDVADLTNSDDGIKMEAPDDYSPISDTQTTPTNGSECATQQIKLEKQDSQTQKRKPSSPEDLVSKKPRASILYQGSDDVISSSEDEEYYMTIIDVPKDLQIKRFLEECGVLDVVDIVQNNERQVQLSFGNEADRRKALLKLHDGGFKGNILYGKIPGVDRDFDDRASDTTEIIPARPWRPSEDVWDTDPLGLYGLKPEFLKSLDITPPIDRWVHVTNFRCDKFELRDVMEQAGQVLSCSVINISKKFAKVQYSHPLEAVQAVSMLHGQLYFGLKLKVYMARNPENNIILPKGLSNIGLGLGLHGRPVRDIVRQYQNYARRQNSAINPILFNKDVLKEDFIKHERDSDKEEDSEMDLSRFIASTQTAEFLNARPFSIKHVEDLHSIDGDYDQRSSSPESNSVKSVGSTNSNSDIKDSDKPNDLHKPKPVPQAQPAEIPAHAASIRLSQANPVRTFSHPNAPQNPQARSLSLPQAPTTAPAPTFTARVPQVQFGNRPYPGPFQPNRMPNTMPITMPMIATIPNPPQIIGSPQPFRPQIPGPGSAAPIGLHSMRPAPRPTPIPGGLHRPGPMSGPGPGPAQAAAAGSSANKVSVQFTNLPPSTTFPLLCEKLSHCGQVVSLQFTTPGCALAKFGHPAHAERCFQSYNGMTVDGYRINVSYI